MGRFLEEKVLLEKRGASGANQGWFYGTYFFLYLPRPLGTKGLFPPARGTFSSATRATFSSGKSGERHFVRTLEGRVVL